MTYVLVAGGGHCVSRASLIIVYAPNMYSNNGGFSVSSYKMEKRLRSKNFLSMFQTNGSVIIREKSDDG